jgi:hypothetical protein
MFVIPTIRCLRSLLSLSFPAVPRLCCSSSLARVVPRCSSFPAICRSLLSVVRCPCHLLSLPSAVRVVPSHSPVVTTSISPYEQWLVGGVVVVCDVASILVQEKDPLPPCEQRLAAVVWGMWRLLPLLLSRGKNLKIIKLVSEKGE